jgi:hypothetical protein
VPSDKRSILRELTTILKSRESSLTRDSQSSKNQASGAAKDGRRIKLKDSWQT